LQLFGSVIDSVASGGVNHIDTAINYRYMKSERTIGAALRYLIDTKAVSRDQVFIASKNGYIPADGDRGLLEEELINKLIELKIVSSEDIVGNCHCIHPNFLEFQLKVTITKTMQTSLDNLGL
jgi:aryl-alcohol dehydrogenase-like predicted oxidoreductase